MADVIDKWKVEEARQSRVFAEAMQKAIDAAAADLIAAGKPPIMNALAGAFVSVEAGFLAGLADPRSVKAVRAAMDKARPRALALAREQNVSRATAVIVGRRSDA
ncbi:hypothetical protein ACFPOB_27105 [Bosea eneae]|uniref:Uncharacterized protein n=1 Tax=Bosea eneae TaxID=151454 RepID=A0ABW0J0Q9_9HYPH